MNTHSPLDLCHFELRVDDTQIAWLGLNCADASVNRLSKEVMSEFIHALNYLERQSPSGLIIHSTKPSGFIAGADINEFDALASADGVRDLLARGENAFDRLARLKFPTLALIRGHCIGGGLELALACRYRLAVDIPDTTFSLPEVKLGIVPGWGGMRRLPALIGAPQALDMMLTGRNVDVRKALRLGLIDAKVPPRLAVQAAPQMLRSAKRQHKAKGVGSMLNWKPIRPLVMRQTEKKLNERDPYQHYFAPRAILEIWARHDGRALKAPELITELVRSDTANNLIRVFRLQEQLKAFGKPTASSIEVQHVHVVGAGAMGGDIAAWCALKEMKVTLQDQDRERIATAQGRAVQLFNRRLKNDRAQRAAMDRLIPDPSGHGVSQADLVIEAITEDLEAKRSLYAQLEPRMKPDAVLASNTSSLSLTHLSEGLLRPSCLVGIHF